MMKYKYFSSFEMCICSCQPYIVKPVISWHLVSCHVMTKYWNTAAFRCVYCHIKQKYIALT